MENYSKGRNVEEPMDRDTLPIPNLPSNFLWMQVHGGSKMHVLLETALKAYGEGQDVVWSGTGAALVKAISCAQVLKRKFNNVHQFNKILYTKSKEFWEPKLDGLDELVVERDLPTIHILLSHQPINSELPGYQSGSNLRKPQSNRPKKNRSANLNIAPHIQNAGLSYKKGKHNNPKPKD